MRTLSFSSAILLLGLMAAPAAQQAPGTEPTQLPVRRVVLYKSGVGYFEHLGQVTGTTEVAIQFTSGQLNDVLKSLTALDLSNGRIASISYNSTAPIEQRLGMLLLPLGMNPDMLQFYTALRGARVEVRTGATTHTGRLLGIERKPRNGEPADIFTVISNTGAVQSFVLGADVTVRILEQTLRDEVGRYLGVIASSRDQDVRRMLLSATGDGTRQLFVSYVSEVPIWKSTYRLVLPDTDGDTPLLQGWAIVDNTVGEDWTDVELSLVAGAPQSFVQQISQPYYAQRPVVPLPQAAVFAPQTHAATLQASPGSVRGVVRDANGAALAGATVELFDLSGRVVAATATNARGEYELRASQGSYSLSMRLSGFGSTSRNIVIGGGAASTVDGALRVTGVSETIVVGETPAVNVMNARQAVVAGGIADTSRAAIPAPPPAPQVSQAARAGSMQAAAAQELGDLFEYRLPQPVTIRTNQSALVPIVNAPVDATRVSLWSRPQGSGRPLRAVWLTNASGVTLDGGTFSVIDGGAFAGEGLLDPLKPGERRLISYGSDLAVMVDGRLDQSSGRYAKVTARQGIVVAEQEDRNRWVYRVRNEDATPRTVVIEHPVRPGWTHATDRAPEETTASAARFVLQVDARGEAELTVPERRTAESRIDIRDIDDGVIASFAQRGIPAATLRQALQPVFDTRAAIAAAERQVDDLTAQVAAIGHDQERVRENMKALRGSREERELLQRYTRELNAQEDRLAALQAGIARAIAERDGRQAELARLVEELTFEVVP